MYTHIDTNFVITVMTAWLNSLGLPNNYPLGAVKEVIVFVMKNIFEWGDMYFWQLLGTAMGTSAACIWATICYTVHEMGLIPKYWSNLLLFLRFIEDMFGIWLDNGNFARWQEFKQDVDNCWHPHMGVRGALNISYYHQNSREQDYFKMEAKLFSCFVARVWDKATIKALIFFSDDKLCKTPTTLPPPQPTSNQQRLLIYLEYHPNDIPRKRIRELYKLHCETNFTSKLGITRTT
ncbi:hypothetical protein ACHAWF_001543, partial [Thalassiosira exigua]